jgi:hypothetical protein
MGQSDHLGRERRSDPTSFLPLGGPRPLRLTNEPILWIAIVKFDVRMSASTVQHP